MAAPGQHRQLAGTASRGLGTQPFDHDALGAAQRQLSNHHPQRFAFIGQRHQVGHKASDPIHGGHRRALSTGAMFTAGGSSVGGSSGVGAIAGTRRRVPPIACTATGKRAAGTRH